MPAIRLLMVDDHSLFRESLCRMLETVPDFHVVAQCATVREAQRALHQHVVDVILLDYDLGVEAGGDLLAALRGHPNGAKVLLVTAGLSDELTARMMKQGAAGIFLKHHSTEKLIGAIRKVCAGETWFDPSLVQRLVAASQTRIQIAELSRPLTERQREVLYGILDGLANKEIAWKLNMSESSVKAVIQELFKKAGVRTRSQLVRIAFEKHASDWLK
jgi:two-component system nitrate/nitrite response regulator NarL